MLDLKEDRISLVAILLTVPNTPLFRCPHTGLIVKQGNSDVPPDLPSTNFSNIIESDHDSAPSPPDVSIDKCLADSKALVATPEMNVEPLSAISMRKSKRLDVGQRRIRRPFSVSEVEALVQAVEKLGTGRYGDDIIMHVSFYTCSKA